MEIITTWFLYFIIYAVLGWAAETVYCSVPRGHFVERGFLRGPLCPIYGAGAVVILRALNPYIDNIFLTFILGMLLTSALEYITGFLMEKIFHMRWWDYSEHRFNIRGRVCLLNSVLFGLLCVALTKFIHPPVRDVLARLPESALYLIAAVIFAAFVADVVVSVLATLHLKEHLEKLKDAEEQLRTDLAEKREELKEQLSESKAELRERMVETKEEIRERLDESKDELKDRLEESGEALDQWREERETTRTKRREQRQERKERLAARVEDNREDLKELLQKRAQRLSNSERYLLRSFPNLKPDNKALERSMAFYRSAMRRKITKQK